MGGIGWYLIGPLIAVGLVVLLGAVFWHMGLQWTLARERPESDKSEIPEIARTRAGRRLEELPHGLSIFGDRADPDPDDDYDYGLLRPAAYTDDPDTADDLRLLLEDAGIRATQAIRPDGRTAILVFPEELDEARRLTG